MPELPEVETIVRYLRPHLKGKRILDIRSNTPRLFRGDAFSKIKKEILGAKIRDVSRLGKNIIFHLSNGRDLVFHLMMTGNLLINPKDDSDPYVRFKMKLSKSSILAFRDVRKFGRIRLISGGPTSRGPSSAEAASAREGGKPDFQKLNLGPDALSLNFEIFKFIIRQRRSAIKNLLLNQKVISGIGNIYSDEILWYAGIKPTRQAGSLSEKEARAIYAAIGWVLRLAIRQEGTSAKDYRKPDGSKGEYYGVRKVYQREGQKCSRDGAVIKRIKIGGRSAHYCPKHQV